MRSSATTVDEYLAELPDDRRAAISTVLEALRAQLPDGLEETINWGMIVFQVPLERYPDTYNGQPLMHTALASQKNHMAVYLTCLQGAGREEFVADYAATGKRMDLGKGCVRFKRIDDLPVDVVAEHAGRLSVDRLCAIHDEVHG